MTIPAGSWITLAQSPGPGTVDWTALASNGPIDGEVTFFFRGAMGAEADDVAARVCKCPAAVNPTDPEDPASDCAGICPCSWLAFQQGDPSTPGGSVIAPSDFSTSVPWFASDCDTFLGIRTRHFMQVDYPATSEQPPIHWGTFATGMTATFFTPSPDPLARVNLVFENPATGVRCDVNAWSDDGQPLAGATAGPTTVLGPPLVTGPPDQPPEVAYPGTFASFSDAQVATNCPIEADADLVQIFFAYRSDVRTNCCASCDDYAPVPLDALMLCPGPLAYPESTLPNPP